MLHLLEFSPSTDFHADRLKLLAIPAHLGPGLADDVDGVGEFHVEAAPFVGGHDAAGAPGFDLGDDVVGGVEVLEVDGFDGGDAGDGDGAVGDGEAFGAGGVEDAMVAELGWG